MLSIALAAAAYAFGAVWYMSLSKHRVAAAGVACDENARPLNKSALAMLVVAAASSAPFWGSEKQEGPGTPAQDPPPPHVLP